MALMLADKIEIIEEKLIGNFSSFYNYWYTLVENSEFFPLFNMRLSAHSEEFENDEKQNLLIKKIFEKF
jgi:hypothetical protein